MSETKSQSIIDNQPQSAGYKDPALSIQERVADLLSRMAFVESECVEPEVIIDCSNIRVE